MLRSRVYLLRHAQAAPAGVLAGGLDYPLTEQGQAQALAWRPFFAKTPIGAVWCSPLLRTRQTAALCLGTAHPSLASLETVEPLREISLGRWEGLTKAEIRHTFPDEWKARGNDPAGIAPPDGESLRQVEARVLPAFEELLCKARRCPASLVVAHQAVNRCILSRYMGRPLERLLDIAQDEAALNILRLEDDGTVCLEAVNCHPSNMIPALRK